MSNSSAAKLILRFALAVNLDEEREDEFVDDVVDEYAGKVQDGKEQQWLKLSEDVCECVGELQELLDEKKKFKRSSGNERSAYYAACTVAEVVFGSSKSLGHYCCAAVLLCRIIGTKDVAFFATKRAKRKVKAPKAETKGEAKDEVADKVKDEAKDKVADEVKDEVKKDTPEATPRASSAADASILDQIRELLK